MAFSATQISVGTTAGLVYSMPLKSSNPDGDYNDKRLAITNTTATKTPVFFGPSGVTSSTGFSWDGTGVLYVECEPGESLYAVTTAAQTLTVLANGR